MTRADLARQLLIVSLLAGGGLAFAIAVPGLTAKTTGFLLAAVLAGLILVLSGRPKEVLLAGYVVALTYHRHYFSFEWLTGPVGNQGLYWMPADIFLVALFAVWLAERAAGMPPAPIRRGPLAAAILPALAFFVPFVISALLAEQPDWGFYETARVLRFVLLLTWLHFNMTRSLWFAIVAGLVIAIAVQSALGTAQVVLKADRNLLSIFGVAGEQVFNESGELDIIDNRARGTLGHPNYVAPYLLLFIPAIMGALLYSRVKLTRWACIGLLAIAVACLVATKSRIPIALGVVGLGAVAVIAVRERMLSLRAAAGGAICALVLITAAALPYAEAIRERIVGDFSASISVRAQYNKTALTVWDDAPLFGIGPNNGIIGLKRHSELFAWLARDLESKSEGIAIRAIAPVHNVYLLILSENGILGLAGFVVLLAAMLWRSAVAALVSGGAIRGMFMGLTVALVLQYVQQTIDFSLWGDPSWYTFAILFALATSVPTLRPVLR